jgi:hypothetical protein
MSQKGVTMKHFKLVILVVSVTVFFIEGMAFAQRHGGQGSQRMSCQDRFDAMDTNHDGKLTKEEFIAAPHHRGNPEEMFKAMDVNGHGYITKEEFCSSQGTGKGVRGRGMGESGSGQATPDEIKAKQALDKKVDDAIEKAWEEK